MPEKETVERAIAIGEEGGSNAEEGSHKRHKRSPRKDTEEKPKRKVPAT